MMQTTVDALKLAYTYKPWAVRSPSLESELLHQFQRLAESRLIEHHASMKVSSKGFEGEDITHAVALLRQVVDDLRQFEALSCLLLDRSGLEKAAVAGYDRMIVPILKNLLDAYKADTDDQDTSGNLLFELYYEIRRTVHNHFEDSVLAQYPAWFVPHLVQWLSMSCIHAKNWLGDAVERDDGTKVQ